MKDITMFEALMMDTAIDNSSLQEKIFADRVSVSDEHSKPKASRKAEISPAKARRYQRRKDTAKQKNRKKELARSLGYKLTVVPQHKLDISHEVYDKMCKAEAQKRDRDEEERMIRDLYLGSIIADEELFDGETDTITDEKPSTKNANTLVLSEEQVLLEERMEKYGNMTLRELLQDNPSMSLHPWVINDILELILTLAEDSIEIESNA